MKNKKPSNITDFLEERNESLTEPPSYPYISDIPTFKVAIYPNKGKGGNTEKLTFDYDIVEVNPKQLYAIFESGNFATTNIFSGSEKGKFHRKKANFKESSVIQIDIDNKPGDGEYFSM